MTYFHKSVNNYTLNKKLSFTTSTDQCQVIDFTIENRKHTLINCYRPPHADPIPFIDKLDETIRHVKKNNCVVTGDFNLNLLNISVHEPTEKYYNMMLSNSFKPIITKPTRITDKTQTIIDHIWTNDLRTDISPKGYIYITDISDHMPCIATFGTAYKQKGYIYQQFRQINDKNKAEFRKAIEKASPIMLFHCNNPYTSTEQKYKDFFDQLTYIYDQHFPIKRKKIHWKTAQKPWITDSIMNKIEKRNKLFSKKASDEASKLKYKQLKKEITLELKVSRQDYYKRKLKDNNDNIKARWDIIREMINRKTDNYNKLPITNSDLGRHYSTVADKLAKSIPTVTESDWGTFKIKKKKPGIFSFRKSTPNEIYENILKLDKNKGPGIDHIDISCTKYIADIISSSSINTYK